MVAFDILAFTHSRSLAQRYLLTHTDTHTHTDTRTHIHIHALMLTLAFIAMCSNVLISIFQLPNPIAVSSGAKLGRREWQKIEKFH